jgi:hypothetical protein
MHGNAVALGANGGGKQGVARMFFLWTNIGEQAYM